MDVAETMGAWLTDPRRQKAVSDRLMESLTGAAQALTSDTSREWIETNLPRTLQTLDVETVTRPFLEELEDVDCMQEFVGHLLDPFTSNWSAARRRSTAWAPSSSPVASRRPSGLEWDPSSSGEWRRRVRTPATRTGTTSSSGSCRKSGAVFGRRTGSTI